MSDNNQANIELTSFFDLKTGDVEGEFEKYSNFFVKLMDIDRKEDILSFWNDKIKINHFDQTDLISWVDLKNLKQNKEELAKYRVSMHAFKDLVEKKLSLKIEDFSQFNILDNILPNFKEVTEFYRGAFALNDSRKKYEAPKPILLLGNPGIGKTYYAKKLAKILNTPYQFLDGNGITANWTLSGANKGWSGADAGIIFKMMAKSITISPILLIDEFDKLSSGKNYDPYSTFHQMFEKENSSEFYDEFVGMNFDASQVIYILTANDKYGISPTLLSRMTVFEIKNPSIDEMKKIIPSIFHSIIAESSLFHSDLEESEIDKLVKFTPREVYQIISKNVYKQASRYANSDKINQKLYLKIEELLPLEKNIGF